MVSHFPFLSLPRELQAEVVRHVGDITALRDLLAIPQVARSVAPFVRIVTNQKKPHWFVGLEKHVKRLYVDELPTEKARVDGHIYILDLVIDAHFDTKPYLYLRNPIIFFTLAGSEDFEDQLGAVIHTFTTVMRADTIALDGEGTQCMLEIEPDKPTLPHNFTLINFYSLSIEQPLAQLKNPDRPLPHIVCIGSLSSFTISAFDIGTNAEDMQLVYRHFKELINKTRSLDIFTCSYIHGMFEGGKSYIDGWDFHLVRRKYDFSSCCQFSNVYINTGYTDEVADLTRDGEVILDMDSSVRTVHNGDAVECLEIAPVLQDVVAPGLRRLSINMSLSSHFPTMSRLWFPHLEYLRLSAYWGCCAGTSLKLDHLEKEHIQELSKLLFVVKELYLNQYTVPLLGLVLPSAMNNLNRLTLQDHILDDYSTELAEGVERLKLRYGKIRMPKLRELRWSSMCENDERVLDFTRISKWFSFPKLETLIFETVNEAVSLKAIAQQLPRIKELKVRKAFFEGYSIQTQSGIYPSPQIQLATPSSFERLELLSIHTGHHNFMFKGVSFPHLKSLELFLDLDQLKNYGRFKADMPVLEILLLNATAQTIGEDSLSIDGFKNLKKFSLVSDIEKLSFFECTKLEQIIHSGRGLASLRKSSGDSFENLKTLRYRSLSGMPCHDFLLSPSVEVDVR